MRTVLLIGLLAGLTSVVLYLGTASGSFLGLALAMVAPLPIFIAGLGWGSATALAAALSASLLLTTLGALSPPQIGGWLIGPVYLVTTAAAPVFVTRLMLLRRPLDPAAPEQGYQWYPAGRVLLWIAGLCSMVFLLSEFLAQRANPQGLPGLLKDVIDILIPATSELRKSLLEQTKAETWDALSWAMAQEVPVISGIIWQILVVSNGLIAHALLRASRHNIRPDLGWQDLTLPKAMIAVLLVALAASFAGGSITYGAATLGVLLFMPYFFLGLTVVHAIPARGAGRAALLGFCYLLFVFVWPAILIGILGLFEQWIGIRARLFAAAGQEDG